MGIREQILGADDRETQTVPVPEWDTEVTVQALSGKERDAYEASLVDIVEETRNGKTVEVAQTNLENSRAKLIVQAVVDEDGTRVFSDDDVEAVGNKSGKALDRIYDVARDLAGISDEEIEEIAKNFGARDDESGSE